MLFEKMKRVLALVIWVLGATPLPGCKAAAPDMTFEKDSPLQLFKSNMQAVPEKRKLTEIASLPDDQVELLNALITGAQEKRLGYVSPRYFVKDRKRVVGIVVSSAGKLIGFDVTTNDASKVSATTTHTVLVPLDDAQAAAFLRQLEELSGEKTRKGDQGSQ
jgi:hypothetical protein